MELNLGGKLMKKVIRYLGMALLLVVSGMVGSCIKDKFPAEEVEGTANVIVKLDSKASGDESNTGSNPLSNEGINSVRLILVQEGKIVVNKLFEDLSGENAPLLEKGFQIKGLENKQTDFYAVINETAIGANISNVSEIKSELNQTFTGFPCVYSDKVLLPMYGESFNQVILQGANIRIPVTRAVARVDLSIENLTGASLSISSVDFGPFFANTGFLVSSEEKDITYGLGSFNDFIDIENGENATKRYYLYEALDQVKVPYTSFTIGLKSGDFVYENKQIEVSDNNQKQNLLKRNTVLKINATVSKSPSNVTCATINCTVAPWEAVELGPTFE